MVAADPATLPTLPKLRIHTGVVSLRRQTCAYLPGEEGDCLRFFDICSQAMRVRVHACVRVRVCVCVRVRVRVHVRVHVRVRVRVRMRHNKSVP